MFKKYINKLTKWIFVPLVLFFVGIALFFVYFFNSDINPNILSFNHSSLNLKNNKEVVSGTFTAQENYLGIITVRFDKKEVLSGDLLFRIKNVLDKDWYHEATVAASQYYVLPQYRFGLPVIAKSKNQTYLFEVRLLDNAPRNSNLTLSKTYPVLISQYSFPKNILLENKMLLAQFIFKKISYYMYQDSSWKVLAIYSIPLILYFVFLLFESKLRSFEFIQKLRNKILFILKPYVLFIFLCIFIDIFVIRKHSDSVTPLFTLLWILGVAAYQLESRYSFGIALVFLAFCPFLLSANMDWMAEKSAIWAYMFLVVGTIHTIFEMKADESKKVRAFFKNISFVLSFITHIDSLLIKCAKKIKEFAFFSVRNFIKILVAFIIVTALFLICFDFYLKFMSYRDRQMKNPGTPYIEPALVYPGTKVFLYGDRFGDNSNSQYALMRDGERVRTDYWEDHKIIFTVPLGWEPGAMNLWIQKPIDWNAEVVIEKTKPVTIKLLPITDHFTPDDDLYFEQLKTWRKETREMNGYQ